MLQQFVKLVYLTFKSLKGLVYLSVMIRKIIFLALLFSHVANSQFITKKLAVDKTNTFALIADIFVGTDTMGSYYYIKNNVLFKQKDNQIWQYQNIRFGDISTVDVINSLKIVVFYEAFNTVVLLDNQLNEISTIDFSALSESVMARNIGMSGQNSLWVFNSINQQLALFNYETSVYKNLNQPIPFVFKNYQTDFNNFIWLDNQQNVCQMDVFGKMTVLDSCPINDQFQFIAASNYILWLANNKMYLKKIGNDQIIEINCGEKRINKFYYHDKILSIFTGEQIVNFNLILP